MDRSYSSPHRKYFLTFRLAPGYIPSWTIAMTTAFAYCVIPGHGQNNPPVTKEPLTQTAAGLHMDPGKRSLTVDTLALVSTDAQRPDKPALPENHDIGFSISGEIRPRAEFRNGFKTLRNKHDEPAFFIEQRSRLNFDYQNTTVRFMLSVQDIRTWGNTAQIPATDSSLHNVREAWAEYAWSARLALKLGRQSIAYENERILGTAEWAQPGRAHDAALVKFTDDSLRLELHLGAAFNQNAPDESSKLSGTFYTGVNQYKTMQYLWIRKGFDRGRLSVMALNDGRQNQVDSAVNFTKTLGFHGHRSFGRSVDVTGEFYYQTGKTLADQTLSAYLAAFSVRFLAHTRMPIIAGSEYISGSDVHDTQNRSFHPTLGSNHGLYGTMDYFYGGNAHGQGEKTSGLVDHFIKALYTISPDVSLRTALHHFSSAAIVYDPENPGRELSRYLGAEIDLTVAVTLSPYVSLHAGYSQMFGSESLRAVKGNTGNEDIVNNWGWAMITIRPLLFYTQKLGY